MDFLRIPENGPIGRSNFFNNIFLTNYFNFKTHIGFLTILNVYVTKKVLIFIKLQKSFI